MIVSILKLLILFPKLTIIWEFVVLATDSVFCHTMVELFRIMHAYEIKYITLSSILYLWEEEMPFATKIIGTTLLYYIFICYLLQN